MARPRKSSDWTILFLDALRNKPIVKDACAAASVSTSTAYRYRDENSEFAKAWDDALADGADELESIAWRKAEQGDTALIIFLLKGLRPDKYRERSEQKHTGSVDIVLKWGDDANDTG